MARSAEENRRIIEEANRALILPWMTYGEYNKLSKEQQYRELQKYTQYATSYLGYWKTCDLSACRRAKACKGFLTKAQIYGEPSYHTSFPPCVGPGGARQQEVLKKGFRVFGPPAPEDDGPKYTGRPSDREGMEE